MRYGIIFLALGLILVTQASAADISVKLLALPELHTFNPASPFALGASQSGFGKDRTEEELELRVKQWDINLVATARTTASQNDKPQYAGILNELNYDFSLLGERFSLGKKILSWGVGFGFRPLDVIQQENRRTIFNTTLEGVPYLAWEKFSGNSAWMLVYVNPGNGKSATAKNDESVAIKYYRHDGGSDLHALARLSERNWVEVGAAFSAVPVESLEWHGSLLYQGRYEQLHNSLIGSTTSYISAVDPMITRSEHNGIKALLGFTLTGEAGFSLLGEAWYDMNAHTAGEWRDLKNLAQRQRALLGHGVPESAVRGNIAYSVRYFDSPNLLRENLLLRLSHKQEGWNWESALDILCTPADGGVVATASVGYAGNHYRLDAGLRQFGGARDSAYRMLPEERVIYFAAQGFW